MADSMITPGARIAFVVLLHLVIALGGARSACAQTLPSTQPGDPSLKVYLVTMGPGKEVWEKFGHNMLVVVDERAGLGVAYHYGVFDFEQPNFIGRFILGRMLYSMGRDPVGIVDAYVQEDRDVLVQELELSSRQKQKLWDFLEWNFRPAHRDYLYDYYRANCSTMIRDALDKPGVLDGQIQSQLGAIRTDKTYRWYTRIGMASDPLIYTGLEIAMGRPTDAPLNAWQEGFIPMKLADRLRGVRVNDASGTELPLVKSEQWRHRSARFKLPSAPPMWWPWFLLAGIAYGTALYSTARRAHFPSPGTPGGDRGEGSSANRTQSKLTKNPHPHPNPLPEHRERGPKWSRAIFGLLSVSWAILSGLAGCFMLFTLTTDHHAAHWNYNLILFFPAALLLILSPTLFRKRKYVKLVRVTSMIVLSFAIVAVLLNFVPGRGQMNWDLIALSLPIYISLAAALWEVPRRRIN